MRPQFPQNVIARTGENPIEQDSIEDVEKLSQILYILGITEIPVSLGSVSLFRGRKMRHTMFRCI
jgi:hypothetical protein